MKRYFYGLDFLRSIMMLLGVFTHSAYWIKFDGWGFMANKVHKSETIWAIFSYSHLFRMETFFLVAGFLSCMVLRRKTRKEFLTSRIKRVFVPLIFGIVIANACIILHFYLLGMIKTVSWNEFIQHGWFLACLLSLAFIDTWLNKSKLFTYEKILLPLFFFLSIYHDRILWPIYQFLHLYKIPSFNHIYWLFLVMPIHFLFYYYLGSRLFLKQEFLDKITIKSLIKLLIIAAIISLPAHLQVNEYYNFFSFLKKGSSLHYFCHQVFIYSAGLLMSLSLFILFYKDTKPSSKTIKYLITSAIAIYIIHQPVVMFFGYYFDFAPISNAHCYALIVILTFITSFAIYEFIKNYKITRFCFGLREQS